MVMSLIPQYISVNPTKTTKNQTAWKANNVTGGRMACTLSRQAYERDAGATELITRATARPTHWVSRTRLALGNMKVRMAASSTQITSGVAIRLATICRYASRVSGPAIC